MYSLTKSFPDLFKPRTAALELLKIVNKRRAITIMEEDWDNLLILDACRFDLFRDTHTLPGELRPVRSAGSKTGEFLHANFGDDLFPDTVYISANPQIQLHGLENQFHDCVRLWETDWNDALDTVHPESVVERAIEYQDTYPSKRLIVHFVQPHYPFIGELGRQIDHGEMIGDGLIKNERSHRTIWEQLENGDIDRNTVWAAYRENLALTLPHVQELLSHLVGKSVVTSDHGNAMGEWRIYGHPFGKHIAPLVKVPWLVVHDGDRKGIQSGTAGGRLADTGDTETMEDRLEALGYR